MERNDLRQNPESEERRTDAETGSDKSRESGVQKTEDVILEDMSLPTELFEEDSDDSIVEDLLLEKELSDILGQIEPESVPDSAAEPEEESSSAEEDLQEEDFSISDEYTELPMPQEEPAAENLAAYAPPAEPVEKRSFFAGLF